MKYQIGDIVKIYILPESDRERIGIILKHRMWNEEVDYRILISGQPNEPIWVLERLIIERIYEIPDR
jgi:hypothetical protein